MSKLQTLPKGQNALVQGTVKYCRLATLYDEKELAQKNADGKKRAAAGGYKFYPATKIFGEITLFSPTVKKSNAELLDVLETEKMYTTETGETAISFRNYYSPTFYLANTQSGEMTEIENPSDIAPGSEVILVLNTFEAQGNSGIGISAVICLDQYIPFEQASGLNQNAKTMLADLGFNLHDNLKRTIEAPMETEEQPETTAEKIPF